MVSCDELVLRFYGCLSLSHHLATPQYFPVFLSVCQSVNPDCKSSLFQWFTGEWGVGVQYEEFTKSLIFRGFDDVLKYPFKYVHLFQLLTLLSKENIENRHA